MALPLHPCSQMHIKGDILKSDIFERHSRSRAFRTAGRETRCSPLTLPPGSEAGPIHFLSSIKVSGLPRALIYASGLVWRLPSWFHNPDEQKQLFRKCSTPLAFTACHHRTQQLGLLYRGITCPLNSEHADVGAVPVRMTSSVGFSV